MKPGTRLTKINGRETVWQGMNWIRPERRLAIYIRDGFRCCFCDTDLRECKPGTVSLDHLTPRSKDGTNKNANLVTACSTCNSSRGSTPWGEFARARGGEAAYRRVMNARRRMVNVPLAKQIVRGDVPHPSELVR